MHWVFSYGIAYAILENVQYCLERMCILLLMKYSIDDCQAQLFWSIAQLFHSLLIFCLAVLFTETLQLLLNCLFLTLILLFHFLWVLFTYFGIFIYDYDYSCHNFMTYQYFHHYKIYFFIWSSIFCLFWKSNLSDIIMVTQLTDNSWYLILSHLLLAYLHLWILRVSPIDGTSLGLCLWWVV